MDIPFTGEPDRFDITLTAAVVGRQGDSVVLNAIAEDGTGADGGDLEVLISRSALREYGLDTCISELEAFLNGSFRPAYRLSAALALGAQGAFLMIAGGSAGPRIVLPAADRRAA